MIYTLDTNVCIRIINKRSIPARAKLLSIPASDIIVCSVVRAELYYGAGKSQTPEATRQKQDLFLSPFASLPFDDLAANQYGQIRASLEQSGNVIGPLDLMIAAVARSHDLILVTHNTREFGRIQGLQFEDWE